MKNKTNVDYFVIAPHGVGLGSFLCYLELIGAHTLDLYSVPSITQRNYPLEKLFAFHSKRRQRFGLWIDRSTNSGIYDKFVHSDDTPVYWLVRDPISILKTCLNYWTGGRAYMSAEIHHGAQLANQGLFSKFYRHSQTYGLQCAILHVAAYLVRKMRREFNIGEAGEKEGVLYTLFNMVKYPFRLSGGGSRILFSSLVENLVHKQKHVRIIDTEDELRVDKVPALMQTIYGELYGTRPPTDTDERFNTMFNVFDKRKFVWAEPYHLISQNKKSAQEPIFFTETESLVFLDSLKMPFGIVEVGNLDIGGKSYSLAISDRLHFDDGYIELVRSGIERQKTQIEEHISTFLEKSKLAQQIYDAEKLTEEDVLYFLNKDAVLKRKFVEIYKHECRLLNGHEKRWKYANSLL